MVRPTDRPDSKQTYAQLTTDHPSDCNRPSIRPQSNDQQTNQPSDRFAINPTTDQPSIYLTDRRPTNQTQFLQAIIAWISGIGIRRTPFLSGRLHGCMYLQAYSSYTYKSIPTSPSDLHFSIWPSCEPLSQHSISEVGCLTHPCKSLAMFGALPT